MRALLQRTSLLGVLGVALVVIQIGLEFKHTRDSRRLVETVDSISASNRALVRLSRGIEGARNIELRLANTPSPTTFEDFEARAEAEQEHFREVYEDLQRGRLSEARQLFRIYEKSFQRYRRSVLALRGIQLEIGLEGGADDFEALHESEAALLKSLDEALRFTLLISELRISSREFTRTLDMQTMRQWVAAIERLEGRVSADDSRRAVQRYRIEVEALSMGALELELREAETTLLYDGLHNPLIRLEEQLDTRLAASTDTLLRERERDLIVQSILLSLLLLTLLSAVVVQHRGRRRLVERLEGLSGAMRSFAAGELPALEPLPHGDALHDLSVQFGDMARKIDAQIENLEDAQQELVEQERRAASLEERTRTERERRRLEKRLQQAQRLESLGNLAGGVAHDINNLLSPILANAEMLDRATGRDPEAEAMRAEIVTAAIRASDLVRRISRFSQRAERSPRPVFVGEVVSEVVRMIERTLPSGIVIEMGGMDRDVRVLCETTELQQVLMNLGKNAIDAMSLRGGVLTVSVEAVEAEAGAGETVRISVEDTGHGMTPEIQDRIFEPYFSTKPSTRGTGLGLAIVFGVVHDMGGTIEVSSEVGRGTRFDVIVPRTRELPEEQGRVSGEELELGVGAVLIVDDEPSILRTLSRMLGAMGVEVESFESPVEALEHLGRGGEGYDLMISDLSMPEMSGIELTRAVRGVCPRMPIWIYTGYGDEQSEREAIEAGAERVLRKPVTRAELVEALRGVAGG